MAASARKKKRKERKSFVHKKEKMLFSMKESFGKKGKCCFLCFVAYEKKGRCFFAFGSKKKISSTSKHFSYTSERLKIYYKV
jgi:hypothetical protein